MLTDDPLVEFIFHAEQLLRLFFGEFVHRDTGPHRQHISNRFLVDLIEEIDARCLHFRFFCSLFFKEGLLLITECSRIFEALLFDCGALFAKHFIEPTFDISKIRGRLHALNPQTRARFIDEVNGFIGKVTVRDVAIGEIRSCDDGLIGDGDPVMGFVLITNAFENFNGV